MVLDVLLLIYARPLIQQKRQLRSMPISAGLHHLMTNTILAHYGCRHDVLKAAGRSCHGKNILQSIPIAIASTADLHALRYRYFPLPQSASTGAAPNANLADPSST